MDGDNNAGKAAVIIEDIVGFGRFQIIVTVCLFLLANMSAVSTVLFMSFGSYNPGWRCNDLIYSNTSFIDNTTAIIDSYNISHVIESTKDDSSSQSHPISKDPVVEVKSSEYIMHGNCELFESCKRIEFNPTSETIVSEWGLLCDKQWISSIIISIQMAGGFVGSSVVGHLGDAFGRRSVLYGALLANLCLNIISIFSVTWEMFVIIRFFLGISCSLVMTLYYIFGVEFVPQKWRSVLIGIPAWSINSVLWALICMILKNWRHIQIVMVIMGVVGFVPVVWVPESLRWLEVKSTSKKFERAAKKVARTNGKQLPSLEILQEMANSSKKYNDVITEKKFYNFFHLFKKGYAKYTITMIIPWFTIVSFYYALEFGIKSLHGYFYINLLVSPILTIPLSPFPIFLPNLVGRRMATLIFGGVITTCLMGAAILEYIEASESIKSIGVPGLVFIAKACLDGMWCTLTVLTLELYPTVVRGIAISWGNTMGRFGSIVAPFLSPDQSHGANVSYTIMAAIMFISCGIIIGLPETKGMTLKDTLDTKKNRNNKNDDYKRSDDYVEDDDDQC